MTPAGKGSQRRTTDMAKKTEADPLKTAAMALETKAAIEQSMFLGKDLLGVTQMQQLERIVKSLEKQHDEARLKYEKEQG